MQVWSLAQEDSLEEETTTHSSLLPGESHAQRNLVGSSPQGRKELDWSDLACIVKNKVAYKVWPYIHKIF